MTEYLLPVPETNEGRWDYFLASISEIEGKTAIKIDGNVGDDKLTFTFSDGSQYQFYHAQDCCESVSIEDIIGDLQDLIGAPLLQAEEIESTEPACTQQQYDNCDSFTWTFYKFATIKGHVTVRWYGSSNGWYSERVSFKRLR